jgi:hypothetical protein
MFDEQNSSNRMIPQIFFNTTKGRGIILARFYNGQLVWSRDLGKGIIICQCKEPEGYWALSIRNDDNLIHEIHFVHENYLDSYRYRCWNCGHEINSDFDDTCTECGWVRCSYCNRCRRPECQSYGLTIHALD